MLWIWPRASSGLEEAEGRVWLLDLQPGLRHGLLGAIGGPGQEGGFQAEDLIQGGGTVGRHCGFLLCQPQPGLQGAGLYSSLRTGQDM